jgi:RNA polymerase sigma-70 factor (ECF subfamily)
MRSETTRLSLLSRVRNPDDAASWREFDARYRVLVLRYCRRRGLQESDAEDVRQVLMMGLANRMRSFEYRPEVGRFRDYLRICTRHLIAKHLSRQNGGANGLSLDEMETVRIEATDEADELWEAEWRGHHLRQAMAKARAAFQRRSLDVFERLLAGDRAEDVAASFGMHPNAVYKVKQRVKDFLHDRIEEQLADEELQDDR